MEPEKTTRERAETLIRLLVPDWRPTPQQFLWAIRIGFVLILLVAFGYAYDITLWDWAKLLIIPAAIAFGGLWFNAQQSNREQNLAQQRAQDEALQAYLDGMSQLLTDKSPSLQEAQPGSNLIAVARARTLTVLPSLDGARKGSVVRFLYEAGLITKGHSVVSLRGADLREANLSNVRLIEIALGRTDLREANLVNTQLNGADLGEADLSGADLTASTLKGAYLGMGTWSDHDLGAAKLSGQDRGSHALIRANLSGANLAHADLRNATGLDEKQLRQARSLEGATMPDGQPLKSTLKPDGPTFEDWLKRTEYNVA